MIKWFYSPRHYLSVSEGRTAAALSVFIVSYNHLTIIPSDRSFLNYISLQMGFYYVELLRRVRPGHWIIYLLLPISYMLCKYK